MRPGRSCGRGRVAELLSGKPGRSELFSLAWTAGCVAGGDNKYQPQLGWPSASVSGLTHPVVDGVEFASICSIDLLVSP